LDVPYLVRELQAEGAARVEIVTDETDQFGGMQPPSRAPAHQEGARGDAGRSGRHQACQVHEPQQDTINLEVIEW
jgi:hypothetical protein